MKFYLLDDDGIIIGSGEGPDEKSKLSEDMVATDDIDESMFDAAYLEDNAIVRMPLIPSQFHILDRKNKVWVEDQELKAQFEYKEKHRLRKEAVDAGFEYNGVVYDFDETSRTNIVGKALGLTLDPSKQTVIWKAKNNQKYTFSRVDFLDFAARVSDHYESLILNS